MQPSTHSGAARTLAERKWIRRLVWLAAAGTVSLLLLIVSVPVLRSFVLLKVSPAAARNANLVRLTRGELTVHLLGTIHAGHFKRPAYSLAHLQAVVARLHPSLLMVEARPSEIDRGSLGDGPIEMPYAAVTARNLGIPIAGIDWWQPSARPRPPGEGRGERIFANLLRQLPERGNVLVLIGFGHIPSLVSQLQSKGLAPSAMSDDEKDALFELLPGAHAYPEGLSATLRQRIADLEAEASTETEAVATELRSLAEDRRRFLEEVERVGEAPLQRP